MSDSRLTVNGQPIPVLSVHVRREGDLLVGLTMKSVDVELEAGACEFGDHPAVLDGVEGTLIVKEAPTDGPMICGFVAAAHT